MARRAAEAAGAEGALRPRRRIGVSHLDGISFEFDGLALQRAPVEHRAAAAAEPRGAVAETMERRRDEVLALITSLMPADRPPTALPLLVPHARRLRRDRRPGHRLLRPLHALLRPRPGRVPARPRRAGARARRPRVRDARAARRVPRAGPLRRRAGGVRARRGGSAPPAWSWEFEAYKVASGDRLVAANQTLVSVDLAERRPVPVEWRRARRRSPGSSRSWSRERRRLRPRRWRAIEQVIDRGDRARTRSLRQVGRPAARPRRAATRGWASTSSRATSWRWARGRARRRPSTCGSRSARASAARRPPAAVTEIVDDVNADPRYLACFLSTRSEIVVPISYDGHRRGRDRHRLRPAGGVRRRRPRLPGAGRRAARPTAWSAGTPAASAWEPWTSRLLADPGRLSQHVPAPSASSSRASTPASRSSASARPRPLAVTQP